MDAWHKALGERVKKLRQERGWKQEDLARATGVDQSIISDIENGADFKTRTLRGLCRALDVSASALLEGEDGKPAMMVKLVSLEGQLIGLFRQLTDELKHSHHAARRSPFLPLPGRDWHGDGVKFVLGLLLARSGSSDTGKNKQ